MGWRGLRQFVFGGLAFCALAAVTAADASAQVSCSGVPAFAICAAYATGASVTYNGSKYTSIAPIPNNRDCPPNSPYYPANDNWWTPNGTCSGGATATSTATATRTSTATATATTARATATATTSGATATSTATRTSTATATRTPTATATTGATATATTSGSSDYTQGVSSLNSTQALAWFTANGFTAGYVILHYTPPGLGQQNVNMTYNSTTGRWEYTIGGLTTGAVVSYNFSYQKATVQYDTPTFSYTHGGGSATATSTSRPTATATTSGSRATATATSATATPTSAPGGCPGCTNKRLKIINGCGQPMWIQYLNGTGGGVLNAPNRNQLATLNSYIEYDIPDIGIAGIRFWPGMGCDATGNNCTIGASGGPASMGFTCPAAGCGPPIDSKFEASFGCLPGVASASCQQNPSAPGTPLGRIDWWNSSAVDGYTLPFQVKAVGSCPVGPQPDGPGGPPGGVVSCTSIKFADCPATENLSSNGAYPSLSSVNLKLTNPNNGAQAGCFSPSGKLTFSQWNAGFTTYPADDPHAQLYSCPTPPITPTQCSSGPAASTNYTNLIHSKCTNTYAYAYDDTFGLATCPSATNMHYEVTFFCPQ
jgi:hypothetical protein